MKALKVFSLFAIPAGLAGLFFLASGSFADSLHLLEAGVNYLPLFLVLSGFAFLGFFCLTAEALYPSNTVTLPIKQAATAPAIIPAQPCIFGITTTYKNALIPQLV